MNTQEMAVFALVLLCLCYVLYRIFGKKKKGGSPCDNCSTGCELHNMMLKKREECEKQKKNK
jgi:hypothetical protein